MPTPYISRQPNELIRAADWNSIQVQTREEIQGHGHTGDEDGVQIGTEAIADEAVNADKLAAGAVTTAKLASSAVTTAQIAAGAVSTTEIAAGAVTTAKLAPSAVTTAQIAAGAVTALQIAAGAVTALQIAAGAVTTAKLAAGAVTTLQIAGNAVGPGQIAANAVGTTQIAAGAVGPTQLAASAVGNIHISGGAVGSAQLAFGAVTTEHFVANAVTTGQIAPGAVTSDQIASGAVTTDHIASGAVGMEQIAPGAVNTEQIADGSITPEKLAFAVGGGGPLPNPLAVNITGSTVRTVPVTPVFGVFALTIPRIEYAIQPLVPHHGDINLDQQLRELVDLFEVLIQDGTSVINQPARAMARAMNTVIDNVPRYLIQQFGEVQSAHDAVVQCLPAYASQLDALSARAGFDVTSPALELVQMIESWPIGNVARSFAYAFAWQLETLFSDYGSAAGLRNMISNNQLIGDITTNVGRIHPGLYAGRMRPVEGAQILRIDQPSNEMGGVMTSCDASVTVGFGSTTSVCVIGIGTETTPPPPGQVVFMTCPQVSPLIIAPIQSTYVHRSMIHLPVDGTAPWSLRLWAVSIAHEGEEPHHLLHARLDGHHVLLEPYGVPEVVSDDNAEPWDDA